jgi:hypothetical protein
MSSASFAVASVPLWLAPSALIVTAAVIAFADRKALRHVALGGSVAALALLAPSLPAVISGAEVVSAASRVARVGSLDLELGFSLDRFSLAASAVVLVMHALSTWRLDLERGAAIRSCVAASGALMAVLGDGLPAWAAGVSIAVAASVLASRLPWSAVRGRLGAAAFGVVAVSVGMFYLAWSLGGQWLDGSRYLSDFGARFAVPVADTAAGAPKVPALARDPGAKGSITLVSHPGARVYIGVADESQLQKSDPIAVSPFVRQEIPAGLQKIVIVPGDAAIVGGDGLEAALVDAVAIQPNHETVISLVGATVTFREIAAQTSAPQLADRRLGGGKAAPLVVALVAFGLLFLALSIGTRGSASRDPGSAGAAALVAPPAAVLVHAIAPVLASSRLTLGVTATVGAVFAAQIAYATWARPRDGAEPPRAIAAIGVALAPGLALVSPLLAARAPLALALAAAFLDRPAPTPTVATAPITPASPAKKKKRKTKQSVATAAAKKVAAAKTGAPDAPTESDDPKTPLAEEPPVSEVPTSAASSTEDAATPSLGELYVRRLSRIASFPIELAVRLGSSPTRAAPKGERS